MSVHAGKGFCFNCKKNVVKKWISNNLIRFYKILFLPFSDAGCYTPAILTGSAGMAVFEHSYSYLIGLHTASRVREKHGQEKFSIFLAQGAAKEVVEPSSWKGKFKIFSELLKQNKTKQISKNRIRILSVCNIKDAIKSLLMEQRRNDESVVLWFHKSMYFYLEACKYQ